jgi:pilus assembly protein Flp/PilA
MLTTLITTVLSFRTDRKGVTALEYGLIASLIAVAIITALTNLGTGLTATLNRIAGQL